MSQDIPSGLTQLWNGIQHRHSHLNGLRVMSEQIQGYHRQTAVEIIGTIRVTCVFLQEHEKLRRLVAFIRYHTVNRSPRSFALQGSCNLAHSKNDGSPASVTGQPRISSRVSLQKVSNCDTSRPMYNRVIAIDARLDDSSETSSAGRTDANGARK